MDMEIEVPSMATLQIAPPVEEAATTSVEPEAKKKGRKKGNNSCACIIREYLKAKFRRENDLTIQASPQVVRGLHFKLENSTLALTASNGETPLGDLKDLTLEQLLFWPDISFSLNVLGLELSRKIVLTANQHLVKVNSKQPDSTINETSVHRFYATRMMMTMNRPEKDVEVEHDLVLVLIELLLEVLEVSNHTNKASLQKILKTFQADLERLKRSFFHVNYGRFLTKTQYYRRFPARDDSSMTMVLQEVINPRVVFKISRTCPVQQQEALMEYFAALLETKDEAALKEFNATLTKGLLVQCACQYEERWGQTCPAKLQNHIGSYCLEEFKCVDCAFCATELELINREWNHRCN